MNRRWICSDVWMDILPSFERAELGLKMALLSDRFDVLVDAHFDGKSELTIWRTIIISKYTARPKAKLCAGWNAVEFPFPDRPLPNKIRFKDLRIAYIDHSIIEFLHVNKHIWDRSGTKLELSVLSSWNTEDNQPIWDVLANEIWPIFATNIRHLNFDDGGYFDILRRRISPTILTDLGKLHSIDSGGLFLGVISDDGPNATVGQAMSKWLHTPSKDGQPKRLFCEYFDDEGNLDWVNSFKETFLRATNSSVSYEINFEASANSIEPFELVNERTKEKLTLLVLEEDVDEDNGVEHIEWLLKRCPISEKAAAIQWENDENWDDNLNKVTINLWANVNESIGPLSPPAEEEKEQADESNDN